MSARRFPFLLLGALAAAGCAQGSGNGNTNQNQNANQNNVNQADDGGVAQCGNGVREGAEECDGADLARTFCSDLGFSGGTLACGSDCLFDKTGCEAVTCGNGALDPGEECDGANLDGESCLGLGFVSGALACTGDCFFDTGDCETCGNLTVEAGEECDGGNLNGQSCVGLGFTSGALACDGSCGFDTTGCVNASCGNGTVEGTEDCDGADLNGTACVNLGYYAGSLACSIGCTFDTAGCTNCGNGQINGTEQCDGANLAGQDCASQGFTGGTLACNANCSYNTAACFTQACGNGALESGEACDDGNGSSNDGCSSGCQVESGYTCSGTPSQCSTICGDGLVVGGEQCDGANLDGMTCQLLGFTSGTLACSGTCNFNSLGCSTVGCGNGTVETGETCDDGNTAAFDGCSSTCQVEDSLYLPVRLRNGEGTNHGMVEVNFQGTWRDICDDTYAVADQVAFANVVCTQLGFTGTGHQFLNAFGGGTNAPLMDDVICTGTEAHLGQCAFRGWNIHNCSGGEAVGVRCMPGEGDIRLVDGPHGMEGRLQIYHTGAWGEVCDDWIDGTYSSNGYGPVTVCQQMGYKDGVVVSTYDAPSDVFVLDDVNCTGTEFRLSDCPHAAWGVENCYPTEGAGFRCEIYQEGDIRLQDGATRNSGRVEVLHNTVWGTVCDDYMESAGTVTTNFAAVACGQLGFTAAGAGLTSGFPDGIDPVWMDNVSCAGSEAGLASCPFNGWQIENCSHYEDMGVTCTP